jgi:competence protein ComEC
MRADLRLAVPVMVGWAIVALLVGFPAALSWTAIALWAGGIVVLVAARMLSRPVLAGLALTLVVAAVLVSVAAIRAPGRQPDELVAAADSGRRVTVTVVTVETARPGAPFDATLARVLIGDESLEPGVPVTVFGAPESSLSADIGSTVTASGALVASDPGEETAFRFFASTTLRATRDPPWYLSWADHLRERFRAVAAGLPGDGGALLPGLAIGDTGTVGDSLDSAMKASSLSHLTAVSGANCAVLTAIVMLAGARLGVPRGWRIGASAVILLGFVVLVTPQPSVLRAAVMAGIVLAALARGRPVSGAPVLALATLLLLLVDPWLSRSYGFVLSVLATGGLVLLARPLAARLSGWMPGWLAAIVAIPLAAQSACQPVLLLLNPSIPTYGVVANLLAEPAAPIATVLGLCACLLATVFPPVGALVAWMAWLPSAWIAGVATFFTSLPGSSIPWPGGAIGVAMCAAVIGLALLLVLRVGGRRVQRASAVVLAVALTAFVGVTVGDRLRVQLSRPGDWQIAACDIGQGDAVLVRSLDTVALIDTGPDPKLLTACLGALGIARIDLLVLSHYDLDHIGGTPAVLGRVTRALVGPTSDADDQQLANRLASAGATVEHVSQGVDGVLGELRWEVLWPRARLGGIEPGNDASVTVRFGPAGECSAGCLTSIFLGDLGEQPQALMMAANPELGPVDVVKVAHHGSADQNERLYQRLQASVGLISVGADNGYGHPTDRLLGILARAGTLVTRTDLEGMVLVSPRVGGGESVWSERSMPAAKLTEH